MECEMVIDEILSVAKNENVSVFGIGPASEMASQAPGYRPEDFLKDARSLVCFGIPIPRDIYHASTWNINSIWRSQNLLYRRLDTLALRFSTILEDNGSRAIPIYGCKPLEVNEKGVIVGIMNQVAMAEITGIGVVGKNGLLLHSNYGARLMLGGLITDAVLPEIHYPDINEPGCPPDCQICADRCPVNAIVADKKKVNIMRCLNYTARTPLMSKLTFVMLRVFNRKIAARYMNITSFDDLTYHICSLCVAECPYGVNSTYKVINP
jgi:epoxyqueuosine reductase QueG